MVEGKLRRHGEEAVVNLHWTVDRSAATVQWERTECANADGDCGDGGGAVTLTRYGPAAGAAVQWSIDRAGVCTRTEWPAGVVPLSRSPLASKAAGALAYTLTERLDLLGAPSSSTYLGRQLHRGVPADTYETPLSVRVGGRVLRARVTEYTYPTGWLFPGRYATSTGPLPHQRCA